MPADFVPDDLVTSMRVALPAVLYERLREVAHITRQPKVAIIRTALLKELERLEVEIDKQAAQEKTHHPHTRRRRRS